MSVKEFIKDKGKDTLSLSRTIQVVGTIVLCAGFMLGCWGRISYESFISFPIGIMILNVPNLVMHFLGKAESIIKAWKGGVE